MGEPSLTNGICPSPQHNTSTKPFREDWFVQKFGGTSVGKFPVEIVNDVIRPRLADGRIVVVCSARSSSSKAEGTTNRLLRATQEASGEDSHQYHVLVEEVRGDHVESARERIKSPEILAKVEQGIGEECAQINRVLGAAHTLGEISARSVDKVVSAGEKLSCRFLAALLEDMGIESEYVDVSEVIDFPAEGILDQVFYDNVARRLGDRVCACQARVPVVTGFFGLVPGGLLERVGRGYTDLCAALVAVGLQATELQVWKEVDGIFTADPRKVPTARLLPQISPGEAAELTFYGSEVIHPFTMEKVIRAAIPIRILNVMNPRGAGTTILPELGNQEDSISSSHDSNLFRSRSASLQASGEGPKRPTAVTLKRGILVLNVHSNRRTLSHGFYAKVFSVLDKWQLSIDMIATSEVNVSMALHSETPLYDGSGQDGYQITNRHLRGAVEDLREYGEVDIIPEMAILSLVGKEMSHMVGVAGKMFSTLGENNVNIQMISQGASEINISCVVEGRDAERAINILHTNLFTFLDMS